jgi:alkanesulfonate monooxygenase SsuD/methylene tetrahydromethanopterin reductase-like flavin-dependent oxidoreductase (luciferase family)
MWLAAHGDETFELAGSLGMRVVTTLYETKQEEVARRIRLYRESLRRNGYGDEIGRVALMLHTYVGESAEEVREQIETGYGDYLFVNLDLQRARFEGLNWAFEPTPDDERLIRDRAVQRLLDTTGLVGTMERCRDRLEEIRAIGVDEVACLVDFGISREATMASLERLVDIQHQMRRVSPLQST